MTDTPGQGIPLEGLLGPHGVPRHFASERRQSRRLRVRIPILVDWGGRRDPGWTVTANEAGALVTCSRPLEAGQRVTVLNVTTGKQAVARVLAPLLSDAEDGARSEPGFRLALRLETYGVRFWGPVYYAALEESRAETGHLDEPAG